MYGEQARYFDMEVSPRVKHKKRGLLSMVNNGSGMHGSQVKKIIYIIRFKLVTEFYVLASQWQWHVHLGHGQNGI